MSPRPPVSKSGWPPAQSWPRAIARLAETFSAYVMNAARQASVAAYPKNERQFLRGYMTTHGHSQSGSGASRAVAERPTVNIRPGVSVLAVLAHLEYKPWYALAEYVDNAIQSFTINRRLIAESDGDESVQLRVDIECDTDAGRIVVRDNAAGIPGADFPRAFRPAELPTDRTGLSEFGMGMKSASCWFAPRWTVRTKAIGESVERTVRFNIAQIVADRIEELSVVEEPADRNAHYTVIELDGVRSMPTGRTSGKIRDHLADVYREFFRSGELHLTYRGEPLAYQEPEVLCAPFYTTSHEPTGESLLWKKSIAFDLGGGLSVRGFAALRASGSTRLAGFSLFRRRRVIQGSGDEKYRPQIIFGSPTSFTYQRLSGELHLEGFEVSHTKDGFRWDHNEEPFLELLKDHLDSDGLPLLRQSRNYRERVSKVNVARVAEVVTESAARAMQAGLPSTLAEITESEARGYVLPSVLPDAEVASRRQIDIDFCDRRWRVVLELTVDPSIYEWVSASELVAAGVEGDGREVLGVRLSLVHPFMQRLVRMEREHLEPVVRLAAAIVLAEKVARDTGGHYPTAVRMNINDLLAGGLSHSHTDHVETEDLQ